jgi:integrase
MRDWSSGQDTGFPTDQTTQQIILSDFDREGFKQYLRNLGVSRIPVYPCWVKHWYESKLTADEYLATIKNGYSYNNAVQALRFYCDFKGLHRPQSKIKQVHVDRLIIAPTIEQVTKLLSKIDDFGVKTYLALCATTMIRVKRLLNLTWQDVDFENNLVLRKVEHKRTKWYRPNPLHCDVKKMLKRSPHKNEQIFTFGAKKIRLAIEKTGVKLTPTQLRDFCYNQTKRAGMDSDLRKWLMGHDLGIDEHYTSDDIKLEYAKFEQAFRLA